VAIVDDTAPEKKGGPSLLLQIALLVGLSVVAIGIGWGSGLYLNSRQPSVEHTADTDVAKATETNIAEAQEAMGVVYLEPITTNLAGPTGTWARLELALVFEGAPDVMMAQTIHQDTLSYLRTVKIHQIEGASGFQHLRSDLEERASVRSGGAVKGILIRTLLFE
jgi:flagellar FliL protein